MEKREIEHKLDQAKKDRATICKGFTEEIGSLQAQLAEAEKPKLGHGDFGLEEVEESSYPRLVTNPASVTGLSLSNQYGEIPPGNKITTIFGNIFDLMKDWGEDLERYEKKVHHGGQFNMKIAIDDIEFFRGGHATASIPEAEEIWRKLGQMIMTLKRKQSIT